MCFLPSLIPYSFSSSCSSCSFMLHWCGSYKGCCSLQTVPALMSVIHELKSPQIHTSFPVFPLMYPHVHPHALQWHSSCLFFFVSLHVPYSCTSWHIPLYLQWLVLLLEYVFTDVPVFFWLVPILVHNGSVSCTAESAGTAHDQQRAVSDPLPPRSYLQHPATKILPVLPNTGNDSCCHIF